MDNRVMVYVRVKPLADQRSILDIVDGTNLIFDPIDTENQTANEYFYQGKKFKSIGTKRNKNFMYTFDGIFEESATNYHIYETITKPMVDATINGLNCSVFAYGATGSGKTYTMLGTPSCPGVIYHTSKDLFAKVATISASDPQPADMKICYFEIYNEKFRDLLRDKGNLPVCDGPADGLVIHDLSYHRPANAEELIELLEIGNANRSQHPTDANADSSRSHAIIQILITRGTRRQNSNEFTAEYESQTSKMSLIDLAGSERASNAYRAGNGRSKDLQREGSNINKSLLALGNCIMALADGKKHIPWRDSKLTRLMKDSMGGTCLTAMIATLCQQSNHYDDTQNTLDYASRATKIILPEPMPKLSKKESPQIDSLMEKHKAEMTDLEFKIRNEISLEFRREMDKMKQSFAEQSQQSEQEVKQLTDKNFGLKQEINELIENSKTLKQEIHELIENNKNLKQEIQELKENNKNPKQEIHELTENNKNLKKEADVLKQLAEYRKDLVDIAEKKVIDSEKEVIKCKEKIRSLEEQNENLTQQQQKTKKANKIRKGPVLDECNEYANMTFEAGDEITQIARSRKKIAPGSRKRTLNESITLSGKKRKLENNEYTAELSPPVDNTRLTRARARKKLAF